MIQMGYDVPSNADLPDVEVIKRNTLISIHKEIHLLNEPYREIFILRTSVNLVSRRLGRYSRKVRIGQE